MGMRPVAEMQFGVLHLLLRAGTIVTVAAKQSLQQDD